MGNNNLKNTNNILIKSDQNNLIYIDPNSVLVDGKAQPRGVEPENFVMYVNLEADLIPRTTLITNGNESSLRSIAGGELNFLRNGNGRDYDTSWTDTYTNISSDSDDFKNTGTYAEQAFNNKSVNGKNNTQGFGIQNISIQIAGANFIPKITIKFIDVRGKTLFESPENSPYAAFFHLPWPIFYLTVKGYYGKAIKYRLHLINFNTRFDSDTGNLEVDTTYVGSTYAYMSDISLKAILNAPYFYMTNSEQTPIYNENTKKHEITVSKSTKGYKILKSVYQEYKNKGLLPKDFPVKTLREVVTMASQLNSILEKEIFEKIIDPKILAGVHEFETLMKSVENRIIHWKSINLNPNYFTISGSERNDNVPIRWFKLSTNINSTEILLGKNDTKTLEFLLNDIASSLDKNVTFGKDRNDLLIKSDKLIINPISTSALRDVGKFYVVDNLIRVDYDGVEDIVYEIYKNFIEQRNKLESDIEKRMNEIVKGHDLGLGFEPTIRNIIGVISANADTYIRLMKDVHTKAFENSQIRKSLLSRVSTDSDKSDQSIYPWPSIKEQTASGKFVVLKYPGSIEMVSKLHSNDKTLWPEVEFVENFFEIGIKKLDPLQGPDGVDSDIEYVFKDGINVTNMDVGVLSNMINISPYSDKSFSSVLYEIYERAKYLTSLSPFNVDAIKEMANIEFDNIKNQLSEDVDIIEILKTNITNSGSLLSFMQSVSTYDRFPYFEDQLPTVPYIKDAIEQDYDIIKPIKIVETTNFNNARYNKLSEFLLNYKSEEYRTNMYPFNSTTYNGYIGHKFGINDLSLYNLFIINPPDDFITTSIKPDMWVKNSYGNNLFNHTINISGTSKHILNTPYFHKQLYNDFTKSQSMGKYVGSAYLLLNSLPFKDLDDNIQYNNNNSALMSSIFREIGASHYIPYHMMLKWGSIYHRYKKKIIDGVDIINDATIPIDGGFYYNQNDSGLVYDGIEEGIGYHPFYENVFYTIVNGSSFFDLTNEGYLSSQTNGIIQRRYGISDPEKVYSSFIDNTKFGREGFTLLPTNGGNATYGSDFLKSIQENFRIIWGIGTSDQNIIDYSGSTLPTYNQYFKDLNGEYSLSTNYRKVVDLIATFKPGVLDMFEDSFLNFASEKLNEEISYLPYDVKYPKFQDLLQKISFIEKLDLTTDAGVLLNEIKSKQILELERVSSQILHPSNLIKITLSNPREIDNYVLGGFTGVNVKNFSVDSYSIISNNIEIYLGEDIDGYYEDFFQIMDVQPNDENIIQFRPLVYMYAGLRANNISKNKFEFVEYLKNNIISPKYVNLSNEVTTKDETTGVVGMITRLDEFLEVLINKFKFLDSSSPTTLSKQRGYNDDPIKLELYNYFKSFNDKWTAGNSIGQRTIMEEFLFLDKANKDIGDSVFLDMQKLSGIVDEYNKEISLFSVISLLIQGTGFDIRILPAYVNFYSPDFSGSKRPMASKNVAQSMFGTFLEVDTQECSSKVILQYIGPTSKHPEMSDISKNYKYKDDGFDIGNSHNNPIIVAPDVFTKTDYSKSNKVVAFEVSFGDQNQSMFNGIELDQATLRNTSESFEVIERLGRNETGSSTSQIDIGLFNIYRQASYQCKVTSMGNMMIQPTMYFHLKNVPLFRGSYLITEVTHDIRTDGVSTTFKGTRIPQESLPKPEDSFLASYRPLFSGLMGKARRIVDDNSVVLPENSGTTKVIVDNTGAYKTDPGQTKIQGESLLHFREVFNRNRGVTEYGIPYNGAENERYIQLVKYDQTPSFSDNQWLRAVAVQMGGPNYPINDDVVMNVIHGEPYTNIKWKDIKDFSKAYLFYSTKINFKFIKTPNLNGHTKTDFLNPNMKNKNIFTVTHINDFENKKFEGPINVGPKINGYGIGLSWALMNRLSLKDGDVIYFRMTK